ncbi:MAG: hypothetical protein WCF29_25475, partial [Pseudolabrys sp.]
MKDIALCTKTVAQKLLVGFSSQSTGEVTPQKLIVLRKASVVRASAARTQIPTVARTADCSNSAFTSKSMSFFMTFQLAT